MYSDLTINSRSRIKRFSHRRRFLVAGRMVNPRDGERILDYGAGDGYFIEHLRHLNPNCHLAGYDPQATAGNPTDPPAITASLAEGEYDKISCLEVIEHLLPDDADRALANIRRLLKPGGQVIVSVPIEIGLSSLFKNIVRLGLGQAEYDGSVTNILKSLLGLPISRLVLTNRYGHMGFYYRDLEKLFRRTGFEVEARAFSPLPFGRILNSQVLYVLRVLP